MSDKFNPWTVKSVPGADRHRQIADRIVPVALLVRSEMFTPVNIHDKVRSLFSSTAWSTLACSCCAHCVCQRRCENCFIEILPFIFSSSSASLPTLVRITHRTRLAEKAGPCLSGPNGAAVVQGRRSEFGMAYLTRVKYGGHFTKAPDTTRR